MTTGTLFCGSGTSSVDPVRAFDVSAFVRAADDRTVYLGKESVTQTTEMSISPDGSMLAVYAPSVTGRVRVYDTASWLPINTGIAYTTNVFDLKFSPDGQYLAIAGSSAPYLKVFETATWTQVTIATPPTSTVESVAWSPDSAMLFAARQTSTPVLYETATWTVVSVTFPSGTYTYDAAWSPDGTRLAIGGSFTGFLRLYDTATWTQVTMSGGQPAGTVYRLQYSPSGDSLVVGLEAAPRVEVYNTTDYSKRTLTGDPLSVRVWSIAFTADGTQAFIGFNDPANPLALFDAATWARLPTPANAPEYVLAMAYDPRPLATLAGEVRDELDAPAERTVNIHKRANGVLMTSTTSPAGAYSVRCITRSDTYIVFLDDDAGTQLNDIVRGRVVPA